MTRPVRKIAFVSPHCVLDFTNGAATATLDALVFLQSLGFGCEAFCNSRLDSWQEVLVEEVLAQRGLRYEVRNAQIGRYRGRMIFTLYGRVPVTLFNSASTRGAWMDGEEIAAFLTACEIFLGRNRPDLVWTYGGDPAAIAVQRLAKHFGIPILFALHNLSYREIEPFRLVDRVVVPTEFARRYYWDKLGLACEVLPLVLDPERVGNGKISNLKSEIANKSEIKKQKTPDPHPSPLPEGEGTMRPFPGPLAQANAASRSLLPEGADTHRVSEEPECSQADSSTLVPLGKRDLRDAAAENRTKYVTFVNPSPLKGVFIFARIAAELARRRADIPLMLVEGASKASSLSKLGIDLRGLMNLRIMPNTPDARQFLAATKLLLMPSLMENAGLVAMEAMLNGIPVLASNRGGLPETIGRSPHPNPLPGGEGTIRPHPNPLREGEGTVCPLPEKAGGFSLDIPARYTPETSDVPTAEEVAPWVETIIRLWDDAAEYDHCSRAARQCAKQWHPDRLAPVYREFFSRITHEPGPPLVPSEVAG